ncbi:hypothetical protein HCH73_06185 [Citrobacter koseri]|uniref:hypothetical protein n=1 Tax=Citrobacter koseri TaxID=545 RepID=UPI0018E0D7EF|nr:hypothetical protein [Citrobacter koseri]MBI0676627.1 hypothetical protein [Citrobacter koseri]
MENNGFDPKDIEDFCDRQKRKRASAQTARIDFVARDKEKVAWAPDIPAEEMNNLPPAKVDRGFLWSIAEGAASVFDAVVKSAAAGAVDSLTRERKPRKMSATESNNEFLRSRPYLWQPWEKEEDFK